MANPPYVSMFSAVGGVRDFVLYSPGQMTSCSLTLSDPDLVAHSPPAPPVSSAVA